MLPAAASSFTIEHQVRTISSGPNYIAKEVKGIVALSLGSSTRQFHRLTCQSSRGRLRDLTWEKQELITPLLLHPSILNNTLVLDLGVALNFSDLGVYMCRDARTGERASIELVAGLYACSW